MAKKGTASLDRIDRINRISKRLGHRQGFACKLRPCTHTQTKADSLKESK